MAFFSYNLMTFFLFEEVNERLMTFLLPNALGKK